MSRLAKSVWGPACWTFLHASAAMCVEPEDFQELLFATQKNLPCPECRAHMASYLRRNPPRERVCDSSAASLYVFEMHNHVNAALGKEVASALQLKKHYSVELLTRKPARRPPFRRY